MKLNLFVSIFAAALACSKGQAQTLEARATMPFDFRVGDTVLKAGDYKVDERHGLLLLQRMDGKGAAFHMTRPAERSAATEDARLRFTRYGDEYYLASIWDAGSNAGWALLPGKHEREVASQFRSRTVAGVSLRPITH